MYTETANMFLHQLNEWKLVNFNIRIRKKFELEQRN